MATLFAFGINILAVVGRVRAPGWKAREENIKNLLLRDVCKTF